MKRCRDWIGIVSLVLLVCVWLAWPNAEQARKDAVEEYIQNQALKGSEMRPIVSTPLSPWEAESNDLQDKGSGKPPEPSPAN